MCLGIALGGQIPKKNKCIYIIGADTEQIKKQKSLLTQQGYNVLDLQKVLEALPGISENCISRVRLTIVDISDEIFVMNDWNKSPEAMIDFKYAMGMSKKIKYENDTK
jgi:hypothetical protein